jgi:hypothetical protein
MKLIIAKFYVLLLLSSQCLSGFGQKPQKAKNTLTTKTSVAPIYTSTKKDSLIAKEMAIAVCDCATPPLMDSMPKSYLEYTENHAKFGKEYAEKVKDQTYARMSQEELQQVVESGKKLDSTLVNLDQEKCYKEYTDKYWDAVISKSSKEKTTTILGLQKYYFNSLPRCRLYVLLSMLKSKETRQ